MQPKPSINAKVVVTPIKLNPLKSGPNFNNFESIQDGLISCKNKPGPCREVVGGLCD
jgi:hypothetical protein